MQNKHEIIDPSKYRSFCFRGEGCCNFVISAKNKLTKLRVVWRLAKSRKNGMMTIKPKCEVNNQYFEKIISKLLNEKYLIRSKVVYIPVEKLNYLSKIPSLPHNLKIESWEELKDNEKYPISFFKNEYGSNLTQQYVCALEMLDVTRIPHLFAFVYSPTITFEIKPKQGFFQSHPGIDIPFCNNCILQIEKWSSATFKQMYDFCPLDLFSGNLMKMRSSIKSLIRDPHRNLRIFVNGNVVHEENEILTYDQLNAICFPNNLFPNIDVLITAIACILAGVSDDQNKNFILQNDSVLYNLLQAQKIDTIGIVRAYNYFCKLPYNVQCELMTKSNLLKFADNLSFLSKSDPRSLVERYLLAATMKDCSLMLSIRLIDQNCVNDSGSKLIRVKIPNNFQTTSSYNNYLYFAYSIKLVDLDSKTAKNLKNSYQRFISGCKLIQSNLHIHKPCII